MRVFTNQKITVNYHLLFQKVFFVIERVTEQSVQFQYFHQTDFQAIVTNMNSKQYSDIKVFK